MSDPRLVHFTPLLISDASWFRPVKGAAWTDQETPSFTAGRFGSAYHPATTSRGAYSSSITIDIPPSGAMGAWIRPIGWSWTNTTASDGRQHAPIHFRAKAASGDAVPLIFINFTHGTGINFDINMGSNRRLTVTNQSIADGEYVYFSVSWQENGASGLQKMYFNGVEVGSATANLGITGTKQNGPGVGGFPGNTNIGWGGTVEIFKLWNYYKTDFTDRERPRFGMNDLIDT